MSFEFKKSPGDLRFTEERDDITTYECKINLTENEVKNLREVISIDYLKEDLDKGFIIDTDLNCEDVLNKFISDEKIILLGNIYTERRAIFNITSINIDTSRYENKIKELKEENKRLKEEKALYDSLL